jgi:hypothetical protein
MVNYIWLFVVAGGAALLGCALAFSSFRQSRRRSIVPAVGAFAVAGLAALFGLYISTLNTAPSQPPDPQGTHYDGPARPSDENALPGTPTPTDNR